MFLRSRKISLKSVTFDFSDVDIELWPADDRYKEHNKYFAQLNLFNDVAY